MNNKKTKQLRRLFYKTLKTANKKLSNIRRHINGIWINQEKKAWRQTKRLYKQGNITRLGT